MQTPDRFDEAHYAREEINHTNRMTMEGLKVAIWVPLILLVLYLETDQWQYLVLVPWATLPILGMMIRGEALVRRHWALYVKRTKLTGVTPDDKSRAFVLMGNVYGLGFQAVMLALAAYEITALPMGARMVMGLGMAGFLIGCLLITAAGRDLPDFT